MSGAKMESNAAVRELVDLAFQLAYFIHDDRAIAMHIAIAALRKLKVASTAQGRRVYYTPTGQSGYRAARTKVSLGELHILQRLVYIESEIYERLAEEKQSESLGQMDLIIRFIKHLVRVTIKRNSFYVSLGLCRVLYNYTTAEAMEIYGTVVQDPERARENYYYRSQKAGLMRELKERFGEMLSIRKAKYGEERFQAQQDSHPYLELVRACLLRFMPWQSKCVLPVDFDPIKRVILPLLFQGDHPDEEHSIELNRIHTLLHPTCFHRLVLALRLDSPDQRLEVPYFFLANDDPGSLGRRLNPPSLSDEELNVISERIAKESARRKKNSGKLLSILVDGIERDRLDLNRASHLRLEIEAGTELIEVRSLDSLEETLLATNLMIHDEAGVVTSKSEVILEGGQALSFEVLSADRSSSGASGALISIEYRETRPLRAVALRLRQLAFSMPARFDIRKWRRALTSKPAHVFLFLVAGIAALLIYSRLMNKPDQPVPPVQKGLPAPATPGAHQQEPITEGSEPKSSEPVTPKAQPQGSPPGVRATSNAGRGSERTRAPKRRAESVTLASVKHIYVSTPDDGPLSQQIREMLISGLESIGGFDVVSRKEEADAMLDVSTIHTLEGGKVALVIQFVNAEGQVLWPRGSKAAGIKYSGYPADATAQALKDLRHQIQRMGRKP
jgi:hypothetical protein